MDINNRVDIHCEKDQNKHLSSNKNQQTTRHVGRPRRAEIILSGNNENDFNKNKMSINHDKMNIQTIDINQSATFNEPLPTSLNTTTNFIHTLKENGNNLQVINFFYL